MIIVQAILMGLIIYIIQLVVRHYNNKNIKEKENSDMQLNSISAEPVKASVDNIKDDVELKIDEIENLYRQNKISKNERDSFINTIINNYKMK